MRYPLSAIGIFVVVAMLAGQPLHANTKLPDQVTFSSHIAPLIHNSCTACHRPGAAGPFSLITYKDVSKRAKTLRAVINDRYMPPWKPVQGHLDFANSRRLTDQQIALFSKWIEQGKSQGDPSKTPAAPTFADGWSLGKPDMVVSMQQAFPVRADGKDVYRSFVLPLNLKEDRWVKAVEFRPSARSVVHHSLFFLDTTGQARKLDRQDSTPGFNGMRFRIAGRLGGYAPGTSPAFLPKGLAMKMPKGSDIILQTHFHPSGKAEMEKSTIAIYFADKPPTRHLLAIQLPPGFGRGAGIDVPPGEKNYTVEDSFTLPAAVEAFGISGHAHYICSKMKMTAALPDGKKQTLLYIDDWDLDWQDNYQFKQPIKLPKGTVIKTTLIYDNSASNPDNPFIPPKRIKWGRESTDEMGSITLQATPVAQRDANVLQQSYRQHAVRSLSKSFNKKQVKTQIADGVLKRLDKNGDETLAPNEIPINIRAQAMRELDLNKDGKVDRDELIKADNLLTRWRKR